MSGHTPGPWTLEIFGRRMIVRKAGDGYITRDIPVCRMDESTCAAFSNTANARLIAAAPELLEAARGALSLLESLGWRNCREADNCRIAIAKAEGAA